MHAYIYTLLLPFPLEGSTFLENNMTDVTPGFKDKAECTPYVSPGNQTSHIATNEGAVSIHNA